MRFFMFYRIETGKVNKVLQYFWGHLNDLAKGFRSKTLPASLPGVPWGDFTKC